jgi:Immunity protein 26
LRKRARISVGDVFSLPLDDERAGCGQVVAKYESGGYYFAIFAEAYKRSALPPPSELIRGDLAFLALSLDAKIHVGDWQVIGTEPVGNDLPLPAYKEVVGTPDQVDVVDYSGARRRRAAPAEVARLAYRKIVAPVRLEKALRALHGVESWESAYDELRPNEATSTASLFP